MLVTQGFKRVLIGLEVQEYKRRRAEWQVISVLQKSHFGKNWRYEVLTQQRLYALNHCSLETPKGVSSKQCRLRNKILCWYPSHLEVRVWLIPHILKLILTKKKQKKTKDKYKYSTAWVFFKIQLPPPPPHWASGERIGVGRIEF